MRRTCLAVAVLAVALLLGAASAGPGALAISSGPLTANPDPVSFGTFAVGDSSTQTVTLTNSNGTQDLTITNLNPSSDYSIPGGQDNCTNQTLTMNGGSCSFDVRFSPGSTGSDNGSVDITDDDGADGNSQTLDLHGAGEAVWSVSDTSLTFSQQPVGTTSQPQNVLVTNNSTSTQDPNLSTGGSNPGDFNISGCGSPVAGSGSCTVTVSFGPNAAGSSTATVHVAGQAISLSGQGIQPGASLSPGSAGFGNQPVATQSNVQTFTLTNPGSQSLTYTGAGPTGTNAGDFLVDGTDCMSSSPIPANGGSCTINVRFNPTGTGKRTATLTVHDNAPSGTQTASLSGTGTPSSVQIAPAPVTFTKPIPAGTASAAHLVTITNRTSSSLPITAVTIAGVNPKSFMRGADHCTGANLAPDAKCTVTVTFTPADAGERTAVLEIDDTGAVGPHTHQLTLAGTATFPHDPKSIYGSVGCSSTHIHWVAPTASRFAGTFVVRNRTRFPRNPGDGKTIAHGSGVAVDKGLLHFTTYNYTVFARYHSLTRRGAVNWSQGVHLRKRTGEICTPQDGSRIEDPTPRVTWLRHATQNGYAFVLQRGEFTIWINYTKRTSWQFPASWRYQHASHRLRSGQTYTFFLYAYPKSHPNGLFIGKTTFTVL